MGKNGYFEFRNSDNRLELLLHAPADGGRRLKTEDVLHCLDKYRIPFRDTVSLDKIIKEYKEETVFVIGDSVTPFNGFCEYDISDDRMSVTAIHFGGFVGTSALTKEEILSDLKHQKVIYGIDDAAIDALLSPAGYLEAFTVARGTAVVEGKNAVINYLFDTEKQAKPSINEDGTVDYHNMDGLNHVQAGDIVATITPAVEGVAGRNVLGQELIPARVRNAVFKHGRNLKVSEDEISLISEVSGHVSLQGNKIFVSNVLEVVNVDNSTGNIDYEGDVLVTGNVLAGFRVKAAGSIEIRGVVEGAYVQAGRDITIVRGVQGMNKAQIISGGDIVAKFIESAENVVAEGDLKTDSLLHSKLSVKGNIRAEGKNGLIVGGDVRSIHGIMAKTIGNEMGTTTVVGVGADPSLKKEMDQLKKDIVTENENKNKLTQIVTALRKLQEATGSLEPDKLEMLQKTTRNMVMLDQKIKTMRTRLDEASQLIVDDENARIKVTKSVFPGTKMIFGDLPFLLKDRADHCQFAKKGAEVKMFTL